jgi:hypothetical protein
MGVIARCIATAANARTLTFEPPRRANSTPEGWQAIAVRGLQPGEWMSLFFPNWPTAWGSLSENFGYVGIAAAILALCSLLTLRDTDQRREAASPLLFAWLLTIFGLAYAMATISQLFYFVVPGMAQLGGIGRALVLWSFGVALLAAFGLDALRSQSESRFRSTAGSRSRRPVNCLP